MIYIGLRLMWFRDVIFLYGQRKWKCSKERLWHRRANNKYLRLRDILRIRFWERESRWGSVTILTLRQEVVEQRAHMRTYKLRDVCVYVSAWYGTMQRLQVLDSRESTNEHKTCQQPWEVGRVSAELLVRSMFALYRGSQGVSDHLPGRPICTNIHFC